MLKFLKIMADIQQEIYSRSWFSHKPKVMSYMVIKGKISSTVRLADINKNVDYNQMIDLTEFEVNFSRDLVNALHRGWVEIVKDRSMMKRSIAPIQTQPVNSAQQPSQQDMIEMAKAMAKTMAEEMMKNNPMVKEMAKEMAREMLTELKGSITVNNVMMDGATFTPKTDKLIIEDVKPDSVFIDVDEKDMGIKANIKEIGKVQESQGSNLSDSLEKIKRFKQGSKNDY